MYCKWKSLWKRRQGADLNRDRPTFSQQQSPSIMSAIYDRTVRTNSYNNIVMKIEVLTAEFKAYNRNADMVSSLHTSGLLEPSHEHVVNTLHAQMDVEMPYMMKMALDFFENSRIASTLCATLLQSIDEAKEQCRSVETILEGMPHSGEALGFMQQQIMAESLSEMVNAVNPFAKLEASEMFADVGDRYGVLSVEVEERRKAVGRKARVMRRWRGGCVAVVVAVVVGVTVVAVVVATHVAVTMAGAVPAVAAAAAAVSRTKSLNARNSRSSDGMGASRVEDGTRGVRSGGESSGVCQNGAGRGGGGGCYAVGGKGGRGAERDGCRGDHGCFCWELGMLTRQSAKLDALARGSFTVNRMLDTLRCLVTGLQDDVERIRKLVEFGWTHREEAKCVQQVGKQLFRSHSHMVRQLTKLHEQVAVCFLIINKARNIVLQEFSPSMPMT